MTAGVRVFFYLEDRERTLDSPTDKLLMSVTAFADELEREKTRQRTHDALLRKARAGHVAGGTVFGYRNRQILGEPDTSGERKRLYTERVIEPAEAEVVRRIFQCCADGLGLRRMAILLNGEGVPAPRRRRSGGSRSWAPSSIREILHRELYRGVVIYNRVQKRDTWGRKRYLARPESEWVTVDAPHLRIVTDDEWARAHSRLSAARASYIKATGGLVFGRPVNSFASPYLLTGLARCSVCGAGFVVLTRDFKRERRPFYACSYHHHRGAVVCPNGLPAEMQATNREVLTSIRSRLARRTVVEQAIEMALADLAPRRDARAAEQEALTTRLRQLEAEMERLTAAVAEGGELPTLLAALKGREGQRVECRRRLEALGEGVHPLDLKRAERRIRERLRDATRLLERQVGPARGVLRELLADRIAFTPHIEAERRWYEFAGGITLGGLLAGVVPQAMVTPAGSESSHRGYF